LDKSEATTEVQEFEWNPNETSMCIRISYDIIIIKIGEGKTI
jgi:hypothetical protein